MMRFLIDANVLSEPTKTRPHPSVDEWLDRHKVDSAVNPIILGELEYGILLLPNGRRRARLLEWFSMGASRLHVIELDRKTAKVWAGILATLRRKGRAMPVKDSLIAATALQHSLTVVTRNTDDYRHAGVRLLNPFET
jgi:predicted nucleic acid-binding protein